MFNLLENKTVQTLDGVPADFQPFYKQTENGYTIDDENAAVKSAFSIITGLANSLNTARGEADRYKSQVVDLSPLSDYGDNPTSIKTAISTKLEELQNQLAGNEDAKLNLETIKADLAKGHAKEVEKKDARITALLGQLENLLLTNEATRAISDAKGDVDLLMPWIRQNAKTIEEDGLFKVFVVDQDGNRRYSASSGSPMSINELVTEMKGQPKYARLFESETRHGGGMNPNSTNKAPGPQKKDMSPSEKIAYGLKQGQHQSSGVGYAERNK